MPVLQKYQSPLWGIWKIEERWEELLCLSGRTEEYMPHLQHCKSDSRKSEWLAVRLLLKELCVNATIAYHDSGVPYLPDSEYRISISHTKGYAAILLGLDKPVGIDIEYRSERIHKIKTRFLNEKELSVLGENPETTVLLVCWSAKETAFKMMEQKVADLQNDIHILEFDPLFPSNGYLTVQETLTPQAVVYRIKYTVTQDFVITQGE
ncbi:MAG: 4'-phosphopantetheinyl transferase superfamily protein [Tannerella sp.]|jgi:phosphopantetheinyl transferase|nr:4'-phosphopantetheinyl transferase superfamily protein [Tannerella sp.]